MAESGSKPFTPRITQDHVELVIRVAHSLSRTPFGRLAGVDELESEALVVLWRLARKWDPDAGIPLSGYLAWQTKRGLLDWLRKVYGREDQSPDRLRASFGAVSIDETDEDGKPWLDLPDPEPTAEQVVIEAAEREQEKQAARALLAETAEVVSRVCTPYQRELVLLPVEQVAERAAEMGMSTQTAHTHRSQGRARVRTAMKNRPRRIR